MKAVKTFSTMTRDRLVEAFADVDVRMRFADVFGRPPNDVEVEMLVDELSCALYDRVYAVHRDRTAR